MPDRNRVVVNVFVYGQIRRLINFGWLKYQNLKNKTESRQWQTVKTKTLFPSHSNCAAQGWLVDVQEIAQRWRLSWWPPPGSPSRNLPAPVWVPAAPRRVCWSAYRLKWSPLESADTWQWAEKGKNVKITAKRDILWLPVHKNQKSNHQTKIICEHISKLWARQNKQTTRWNCVFQAGNSFFFRVIKTNLKSFPSANANTSSRAIIGTLHTCCVRLAWSHKPRGMDVVPRKLLFFVFYLCLI